MTRLDRHVQLVRTKMFFSTFLRYLAWGLLILAGVVLVNVLVDRFLLYRLPAWKAFFFGALGVTVIGALVMTILNRPSSKQAAVAIDERLGLKEKFSTALFIRADADPFSAAAVRDAEQTAQNVNLQRRFPLVWPRAGIATAIVAIAAGGAFFVPTYDLFGRNDPAKKTAEAQVDPNVLNAKRVLQGAIAKIDSAPLAEQQRVEVKEARRKLANELAKPRPDLNTAHKLASDALKEKEAITERIKEQQRFADAQNQMEVFRSVGEPTSQDTPASQAQAEIAKGNFEKASEALESTVGKFQDMDKEQQKKTADDMQKLAQQLQKIAQDQQKQQDMQKKMQDMGANQQQVQQLAQAMQAAANGDKQAQQQVQQMANQIAQQINQNPNLNAQQQQQIAQNVQNLAQQMQNAANNQAAAQQMAQAAQQMAQAMQQAAQANQAAGQPGGQQANAGNQAGGQGQQMADAMAQMQQQLQQMQQAGQDAEMIKAMQEAAAANQGGGDGQGQDGQPGGAGGQGWKPGDPNQNVGGQGGGGAGIAAGGQRPKGAETPVGFKSETAIGATDDKGKLLASTFVKALGKKGESTLKPGEVIEAAEKESAEEVEQDRIPRQVQKAVREYFDDLKRGEEK